MAAHKQLFLQACMNHGSIESCKIKDIMGPICKKYGGKVPETDEDLKSFIKELNADINQYNMSLALVKHSIVNKEYLVFAITTFSDVSKRQLHLKEVDRLFFTKLLENLVQKPEFSIPAFDAFDIWDKLPQNTQNSQRARARELLDTWKRQGYFLLHNELLYFGPRILVEYAPYLKKYYAKYMQDCSLCNKLVLWDVKCSHCQTKLHRSCIRHFLIKNSNCPVCNKLWNTRLSGNNENNE